MPEPQTTHPDWLALLQQMLDSLGRWWNRGLEAGVRTLETLPVGGALQPLPSRVGGAPPGPVVGPLEQVSGPLRAGPPGPVPDVADQWMRSPQSGERRGPSPSEPMPTTTLDTALRYFYNLTNPQLGVDQALRELGISPTAGNPYTQFVRQDAQRVFPLFMATRLLAGQDMSAAALRDYLLGALRGAPVVPAGTSVFAQAARAANEAARALGPGGVEAGTPPNLSHLALRAFLSDPQNAMALLVASSGVAPGIDRYLLRALQSLYSVYQALAPLNATTNTEFVDYLAGLGGPGPLPTDWVERAYSTLTPEDVATALLEGRGSEKGR